MNRLRAFRNMLGISRQELASAVGRSAQILEKYEAELPPELALTLARYARESGRDDAAQFLELTDVNANAVTRNSYTVPPISGFPVGNPSAIFQALSQIQAISTAALEGIHAASDGDKTEKAGVLQEAYDDASQIFTLAKAAGQRIKPKRSARPAGAAGKGRSKVKERVG